MRVHLVEEVENLKKKGKTHFDHLYQTQEGKCIAESKFADAEKAIKVDRLGFQEERDCWAKEKADL